MPRPTSRGLEYTFLDKNFFFDRKVKRLKRKCGDDAPYAFLALLCLITPEGYYIKYDNDTVYDIADMTGFDEDRVAAIIDACGEVGLLDMELMEREHILTSHGIQKYYATTCSQLKRKTGVYEYSLLNDKIERVPPEETPVSPKETRGFDKKAEFPPKKEEEIPAIGKEMDIKERDRRGNSFSSSSSPSPSVEVDPSEDEEQQEQFLSYMFFKNWAAPNKEMERFVAFNNTENRCWAKMDKTQRESALILWKQKPEQPPRFGKEYLGFWWKIFDKLIECKAPHAVRIHALSDNIKFSEKDGGAVIACPEDVRDFIEANIENGFRSVIRMHLFRPRGLNKMTYEVCPP